MPKTPTPNFLSGVADEIHEAVYYRTQGLTRKAIATQMGRTEALVKTRLGQAKAATILGVIPVPEMQLDYPILVDRHEEMDEEMDRRETLVANRVAKKVVSREFLNANVAAAVDRISRNEASIWEDIQQFKRTATIGVPVKTTHTEEALAVISDLHHCRHIRGVIDETMTEAALMRYVDTITSLTARQRAHVKVEVLNLAILGDILHGVANWGSQARETSGNASYQIARTADLLIRAILKLRYVFSRIKIKMVPGNHGRRSREDDVMTDNLELDLYRIIEARFADCPDVEIEIADENFYLIADILGRKFMLMHGDHIKGAGNPQNLVNTVMRYQAVIEEFDEVVMGHWHRLMRLPLPPRHKEKVGRSIWVNGTASLEDTFLTTFGSSPTLAWWFLFTDGKRTSASYDVSLFP